MAVTNQEIKDAIEIYENVGFDDKLCEVVNQLQHDQRLSDDPLTALAAVMRVHDLTLLVEGLLIDQDNKIIFESTYEVITENDIKPEE